jgi:hypothetical protein
MAIGVTWICGFLSDISRAYITPHTGQPWSTSRILICRLLAVEDEEEVN